LILGRKKKEWLFRLISLSGMGLKSRQNFGTEHTTVWGKREKKRGEGKKEKARESPE